MARVFSIALATGLVMAVVVTIVLLFTVNRIAVPKDGVQYPGDFVRWSLHDQNEWRVKNLDFVSGIGYIRERMRYPGFAEELFFAAGSVFVVSFPSCLLFAFFSSTRSKIVASQASHDAAP
jgi:hypothetical protein